MFGNKRGVLLLGSPRPHLNGDEPPRNSEFVTQTALRSESNHLIVIVRI